VETRFSNTRACDTRRILEVMFKGLLCIILAAITLATRRVYAYTTHLWFAHRQWINTRCGTTRFSMGAE